MTQKIKIFIGVVLVLAVAAVAVIAISRKKTAQAPAAPQNKQQVQTPSNDSYLLINPKLSSDNLAQILPAGFPTESGGKLVQSQQFFGTKSKDIKTVRTTTTSVKVLVDATKPYLDFLQKNGWNITDQVNQPVISRLSAQKNSEQLDITAYYDSGSKSNVIIVSYIKPQAPPPAK